MRDVQPRPAPQSKASAARPKKSEASAFATSKKDKRQIKHSTFVSKITKDNPKKSRRRRPNKKLVATLDSLADALPDVEDEAEHPRTYDQVNIIRHKSVKTRPGAMKRKEKLEKSERERFAKNLAEMSRQSPAAPVHGTSTNDGSTSGRWQALRSFISSTMERLPDNEKT